MILRLQKRLASEILRVGKDKVYMDPERLDDIKEAITREDVRLLISVGAIKKKMTVGNSRVRARKRQSQKRKGRRKGAAHRKGGIRARTPKKEAWESKVRAQRQFLKMLKQKKKIKNIQFNRFYKLVKGGFFRSVSHMKLFMKKGEK
jgi:large subunit ribosomal protein L19e